MPIEVVCSCGHRSSVAPSPPGKPIRPADTVLPAATVRTEAPCPACGRTLNEPATESLVRDSETGGLSPVGTGVRAAQPLPAIPGFEVRRELGRGGMGVVYEAFDPRHRRLIALKTLPRLEPRALSRFKQEFRSLADVVHPNVITLHELVSDGHTWFFGMELLDGVGLLEYVRGDGGKDAADESEQAARLSRLRHALPQLCTGVAALHQAGVLHRDLKPSNVMVTRDGRVVVLDFGLAARVEQTDEDEGTGLPVIGTPHYMAPEQAASQPISPASDWYAVGVVLYEALTGQLPFGGSPLQILIDKQRSDPPLPTAIVPGLPVELEALCMELLRRDPAARPTAAAILAALRLPEPLAAFEPSRSGAASSELLVGRDSHLALLRECLTVVARGEASTAFVHGRSGMGKTALVQRFLDEAHRQGALVVSGRCYERESVPFKAFDCLVDELNRHLRRLPQAEAAAVLPREYPSLVRLFPVLAQAGTHAGLARSAPEARDEHERHRGIGALRELLARLAERRPLVLFIDDLQWGDDDSAVLLAELLKPPEPPTLLFIGAYRAEDVDSSAFLVRLRQLRAQIERPWRQHELGVDSLSAEDTRSLTHALLGRRGDEGGMQAELIAVESAGSPFFIHELVRYRDVESGQWASGRINLEEVLWSRVRRLPPPARRLLEVVAVAGRPTLHTEAFAAAGVESDGPTVAAMLRTAHLTRNTLTGDETVADTYHDRVREAVLAGMDSGAIGEAHLALAEVIEGRLAASCPAAVDTRRVPHAPLPAAALPVDPVDWQRVFDLASHLDAAGQPGRAMPFALAAGERARAQYSLAVAEQQLLIAERGLDGADVETQFRVVRALGEVLMLAGRYDAARSRLEAARSLAQGNAERAEVEGQLGELAFKQGDLQSAYESLERALGLLGQRTPDSGVVRLAWESLVQALHTLVPRFFLARRSAKGAARDLQIVRLWNRQGYANWFCRGVASGLANHMRSMNIAESYPPTPELAQVYSDHAAAMSVLPWFSRGSLYARKSLQLRQQQGDVWGLAQSLHFFGVMLYAASRYSESVEKCREAIRLFQQTGDSWEVNTARFNLAASLYRLGDLGAAAEEALRMHRSGLELGDAQAASLGLDILAKATRGQVSRETLETELGRPRRGDVLTACQLLQAEGVRRFYAGEHREAAADFERAYEVARAARLRNTYVVPALPWLATALRCAAEEVLAREPSEARRLLGRAQAAARRALRLARWFRNDLPHALRECALVAAASGAQRRSRRLFEESLHVSAAQDARYEHALTMQALGAVGRRLGWPDAESWADQAEDALAALARDGPRGAPAVTR